MEEREGGQRWRPDVFYRPPPGLSYAVIILNQALTTTNVPHVKVLWQNACVRMCVDGGTNGYHKLMRCGGDDDGESSSHYSSPPPQSSLSSGSSVSTQTLQTSNMTSTNSEPVASSTTAINGLLHSPAHPPVSLPDLISGDFDSIRPELLKLYGSLGVTIVPTPDQDETDFTKAVKVLGRHLEEQGTRVEHIMVVAGVCSDRFDHFMANLATLYEIKSSISVPVIVLNGGSLLWVLAEGIHRVEVSQDLMESPSASWCALVPLGHPTTVSTTGLKWNLANQTLAFGTLVSTSNTYDPTHHGLVDIVTSHPLLWTMGWEEEE